MSCRSVQRQTFCLAHSATSVKSSAGLWCVSFLKWCCYSPSQITPLLVLSPPFILFPFTFPFPILLPPSPLNPPLLPSLLISPLLYLFLYPSLLLLLSPLPCRISLPLFADLFNLLKPFAYSHCHFPPRLHLNNTNPVYICQQWDDPIFMNIIEHIPAVRRWCQGGSQNKESHLEAHFS